MGQSIFAASMDVEYEVRVPRDRGKTRIIMSFGEHCFQAGAAEHLRLGENDVATLYSKIPGVRIRPVAAPKQPIARAEPVTEEKPVEKPKKKAEPKE